MAKRCRKEIPALARITDVLSHLLAQSRSRYVHCRMITTSHHKKLFPVRNRLETSDELNRESCPSDSWDQSFIILF
jgi:hypothetical protein